MPKHDDLFPNDFDMEIKREWMFDSVLPNVPIIDGRHIVQEITPAVDLLGRWGYEPFELALFINAEIKNRSNKKSDDYIYMPSPYKLIKATKKKNSWLADYYLTLVCDQFPFKYSWEGDILTFNFDGIVYKPYDIEVFESQNKHLKKETLVGVKTYNDVVFLKKFFPEEGPQTFIKQKVRTRGMDKANEVRRKNTETGSILDHVSASKFGICICFPF